MRLSAGVMVVAVLLVTVQATSLRSSAPQQVLTPTSESTSRFVATTAKPAWAKDWPNLWLIHELVNWKTCGVEDDKKPRYETAMASGLKAVTLGSPWKDKGADGTVLKLQSTWTDHVQRTWARGSAPTTSAPEALPKLAKKSLSKMWYRSYRGFYQDIKETTARKDTLGFSWVSNSKTFTVTTTPLGFQMDTNGVFTLETHYALPTASRAGADEGSWESKSSFHNAHLQLLKVGTTLHRTILRHGVAGYKIDSEETKDGRNTMKLATHMKQAKLVLGKVLATNPKPKQRVVFNSLLVPVSMTGKGGDLTHTKAQHNVLRALRTELTRMKTNGGLGPLISSSAANFDVEVSQVFYDHTSPHHDLARAKLNVMGYAYYAAWAMDDAAALAKSKTPKWHTDGGTVGKAKTLLRRVTANVNGAPAVVLRRFIGVTSKALTPEQFFQVLATVSRDVARVYLAKSNTQFWAMDTSADKKHRVILKGVLRAARITMNALYGPTTGSASYKTKTLKNAAPAQEKYLSIMGALTLTEALLQTSGAPSTPGDAPQQYQKAGSGSGAMYRRAAEDAMEAAVQDLLQVHTFINCKSGADRTSIVGGHHYCVTALSKTATDPETRIAVMVATAINWDRIRQYVTSTTTLRNSQATFTPPSTPPAEIAGFVTALGNGVAAMQIGVTQRPNEHAGTRQKIEALLPVFHAYRNCIIQSYTDMSVNIDFGSTGVRGIKVEVNPNIGETIPDVTLVDGSTNVAALTTRTLPPSFLAAIAYGGSFEYFTHMGRALVEDYSVLRAS